MKLFKTTLLTAMTAAMIVPTTFAAEQVGCDSDVAFADNNCQVCYSETAPEATEDGGTYTVEISGVEFPWINTLATNQLIYENEQVSPEIHTTMDVTQDPEGPDFWQYGEDILWTEWEGENEFYLEPGGEATFRKSGSGSVYTLSSASVPEDEKVLLVSPLVYREYDLDVFDTSEKVVENSCVLYNVTASAPAPDPDPVEDPVEDPAPDPDPVEDPVEDPAPDPDPVEDPEDLNSAGPAVITGDQTGTDAGAEHVVIFALAVLISAGVIALRRKRS